MLNLGDGQKAICVAGGFDEFVSHRYYFRSVLFYKQ
jgi:hypothetical protein